MLEQIFGRRRRAACWKTRPASTKAAEASCKSGSGEPRRCRQQLTGGSSPDGGADLCHILGRWAEPVEAPQQLEACRVAGAASDDGGTADIDTWPRSSASLDHRLGQFLDKERHPIGALDDLVDNIRRQRPEMAGEPMHERRPSRRPSRFSAITVTCDPPTQGGWNSGR